MSDAEMTLPEALAEIERLRTSLARLAEAHAVALGKVGPQFEPADEPFTVTHNVPGNAPT
jgi:hypothetical protein